MEEKCHQLLQFVSDCKEFFSCTVCKELLVADVYRCKEGHFVCQFCKPKLIQTSCPMCRDNIQIDIGISRFISTRKWIVSCRFQEDGCPEDLELKDLVRHMIRCSYRHVYCQLSTDCLDSGVTYPLAQLLTHWNNEHSIDTSCQAVQLMERVSTTLTFRIGDRNDDDLWPIKVLNYKGKTLLFCISLRDDNIIFWMASTELVESLKITYTGEFLAYNQQNHILTKCGFSGLPVYGVHKHSVCEAIEEFGVGIVASENLKCDKKGAMIRQLNDDMQFSVMITID